MLALHLSTTPLVGAPGRICEALKAGTNIVARWGVLRTDIGAYERMRFKTDLVWDGDREQLLDLAEQADVIHLHNFIDLHSNPFDGIDLFKRWTKGKAIVRQFHSTPDLIARSMGMDVARVHTCPIPKLVIAQYPERFYPNARLVPNIVEISTPQERSLAPIRIGFAPSRFASARDSRWDTKGYPETIKLLAKIVRQAKKAGVEIQVDVIEKVPHHVCLERKARCHIVIDDLVTGSYHLSTLESLAAGSVVLTYIDPRVQGALFAISGRTDLPVVNVELADADQVLLDLINQPELVIALGRHSHEWMKRNWNPQTLVSHFTDTYQQVIASPNLPFEARHSRTPAEQWYMVDQFDSIWRSRARYWSAARPKSWNNIRGFIGSLMRRTNLRRPNG